MRSQRLLAPQGDHVDVSTLSQHDLLRLGDDALGMTLRESLARDQEEVYAGFDNHTPPAHGNH